MQVSKRILFFKSKKNGYLLFCGNSNSIYKIEAEKEIENIKKMLNRFNFEYLIYKPWQGL